MTSRSQIRGQYKETLLKSVGIATANKNLHSLSRLWNWALGQGFVPEGSTLPVAGLLINKRLAKKEKLQRKPFTDPDLAAILSHKDFLSQRTKRRERYWLVCSASYSRVRLQHRELQTLPPKNVVCPECYGPFAPDRASTDFCHTGGGICAVCT